MQSSVKLISNVPDKFCVAKSVPITLEDVAKEIDALETKCGIKKCASGGMVNTSPVVWVGKQNGWLYMRLDYKVNLNIKYAWRFNKTRRYHKYKRSDNWTLANIKEMFHTY